MFRPITARSWLLLHSQAALLAAFVGIIPAATHAQYQPPSDYYNSATGVGPTLRTQLRAIIGRNYWVPNSTSHQVRSYDLARQGLFFLARDPADATRVILIYDGRSVPGAWDSGVTWNREHTWPDSRGLGGSGPDYSDLHQLRPCTPSVNSSRGNNPFGVGAGSWDPQPSTNPYFAGSPSSYVAGTNDRGEMARAMMYMDVRYDATDPSTTDLVLVNGFPSGNQMGDLAQLLAWHYEDPVNDTERLRNHLIFSNTDNPLYHQGNRNPFVDRPEFVWALFGTGPNDSQIFVGAGPASNGSSSASAVFRGIAGSPLAPVFTTVTKSGATPTTFDITFTGSFMVAGAGRGQAFTSGADSTLIAIAPVSTSTVGISTGVVTINNTDLTSSAAGRGSADADDLVNITHESLQHANGSFASTSDINAGVITSALDVDTGVQAVAVGIHNFGFAPTSARLDIDSVSGGAPRFAFVGGLATGIGAVPGSLSFSFDTAGAAPGVHSANFIINLSDENVPGATVSSLSLTWDVTISAPPVLCPGDGNADGLVDFRDITAALENYGASYPGETGPGDANHDGFVGFGDITAVLNQWGLPCP